MNCLVTRSMGSGLMENPSSYATQMVLKQTGKLIHPKCQYNHYHKLIKAVEFSRGISALKIK